MEPKGIHAGLYEKYKSLGAFVDALEPSVITMMYKEYKNNYTFFPNIGLFFNEFSLIYTSNMSTKLNKCKT